MATDEAKNTEQLAIWELCLPAVSLFTVTVLYDGCIISLHGRFCTNQSVNITLQFTLICEQDPEILELSHLEQQLPPKQAKTAIYHFPKDYHGLQRGADLHPNQPVCSGDQSPRKPHIPTVPHIRHKWGAHTQCHKIWVYLQELVQCSTTSMESTLLLLDVRPKSRSVPPHISFPRKAYANKNMHNQYFYIHHCKVENALCYMKHYRLSREVDSALCAVTWRWFLGIAGVTSYTVALWTIWTVSVMFHRFVKGNFTAYCYLYLNLDCQAAATMHESDSFK